MFFKAILQGFLISWVAVWKGYQPLGSDVSSGLKESFHYVSSYHLSPVSLAPNQCSEMPVDTLANTRDETIEDKEYINFSYTGGTVNDLKALAECYEIPRLFVVVQNEQIV